MFNSKILVILQKFSIPPSFQSILFFLTKQYRTTLPLSTYIISIYLFTSFLFSIIIIQQRVAWKEKKKRKKQSLKLSLNKVVKLFRKFMRRLSRPRDYLSKTWQPPPDRIVFPPSCKCVPTVARGSRDSKTIGNTPLTLSTAALSWRGDRFTIFERSWGEGRDFRPKETRRSILDLWPPIHPANFVSFHATKRVEEETLMERREDFFWIFLSW